MANLNTYRDIEQDFDFEAQKCDGIFTKARTECDQHSINYLKEYIQPWHKVLEIGAGKGNVIEALGGERHALDISARMLEECNIENKKVGNMDELPYEDESFDIVYMIMTFQQSQDREKTLSEMKRVTKESGWMFIIDGDRDSSIGQLREKQIKEGSWKMVGDAKWLSRDEFPEWEATHFAPHILCLQRQKDDDWTMEDEAMDIILNHIKTNKPKNIVEIGSGISTKKLAELGKVYSIEPNTKWLERTKRIVKDLPVIFNEYPDEINLLIIDGPEGVKDELARMPAPEILKRVKGTIFIHDANRKEEKEIANKLGNPIFHNTRWGLAEIRYEKL